MTVDQAARAKALVVYADRHVIVFDKPAGLASQGGRGIEESLDDLAAALGDSPRRIPRLAHRLDRDTSGLLIAGRTRTATAFLNAAFAERRCEKTYLAIVCGGAPDPVSGEIAFPLRKHAVGPVVRMRRAERGEPGAQDALTAFTMMSASAKAALVAARPRTGRMHQIRAHFAGIGRPIGGDASYGGLMSIGDWAAPRLMLHAARLEIPHPDGGVLDLRCPPPADFEHALAALGLSLSEGWRERGRMP